VARILSRRTERLESFVLVLLVAAGLVFTFLPLRERFSQLFVDPSVPDEMPAAQFLQSAVSADTTV
jgi:hypothetical protein